ncbi:lipoprotein N-acyltransferase Lnb domain-containing protein [Cellulophaga tyrosinoxydans]|uniref:Uncharacterized protein n=1 Tax=Cellulophaga tyrosinoxydans TaxID=504486 RepID=A0A1W2CGT0_9FLAO|nr:DUF4105 domain-containing protein [Cellulophaga tyrosinoxydans]SMC84164.1 protein of unknown function [Cellulophaga tyrosinoxydans]
MRLYKCILSLLLVFSTLAFAQPTLSDHAKISILTIGTADELYAKFGHSAIRIQDAAQGIDVVYNYGQFDFNTPNFYLKFTQGKLLYRLSRISFANFLYDYEVENRWVKEQQLLLSSKENNELFAFLENNYLPENRYYKYDFLFDNCSTRIPAALKSVLGNKLIFEYGHLKDHYTFRELIHQNLEVNSWSNFGIDLALGSVIDRKATPSEHMFLPIYVYKQLPNTKINKQPLVLDDKLLLDTKPVVKNTNFFTSPLFWLTLVSIVIIGITYSNFKSKTRSRIVDFTLFFITGLAGLIIVLLWFATDHQATAKNFNFLWTFPLNLIIAFVVLKKKKMPKWILSYMYLLLAGIFISLAIWLFKVQIFNILIIPILIALVVRYSFLIYSERSNIVH